MELPRISSALDNSISEILQLSNISEDHKWILYFRALENNLYIQHPSLEPFQFNFKIEEENGVCLIKIQDKVVKKRSKLLKYFSFCIGPCLSSLVSTAIRRCDI